MSLPGNLWSTLIFSLLVGCTVTGPADDGYERNNEWVDNGRLLSDEARTIFRSNSDQVSNVLPEKTGGEVVDGTSVTGVLP